MRAWALLFLLACHGSTEPSGKAVGSGSAHRSVVDDEVQRALVLDAALKKLEGELAQLEAAPQRDEALIAEKKQMRQALQETLAKLQRRIDEREAAAHREN